MALPLLAAVGAGILGGRRYLLNKQDEKTAQASADQLSRFVMDSPALNTQPHLQDELLSAGGSALNGGSTLGDFNRTGALAEVYQRAQAYQRDVMKTQQDQNFRAGMQEDQQRFQQLNQDRQQRNTDREFYYNQSEDALDRTITDAREARDVLASETATEQEKRARFGQLMQLENDMEAQIKPHEVAFRNSEGAANKAWNALSDDSLSAMESHAAMRFYLKTLLPEEAIMEGDLSGAVRAGGVAAQIATELQRWKGGDNETFDRDAMKRVLAKAHNSEATKYDRYKARTQQRIKDYQDRGFDVRGVNVFGTDQNDRWQPTVTQKKPPGIKTQKDKDGREYVIRDGMKIWLTQ